MNASLRGALLVALGFALLVAEGALATILPTRPFMPNLIAPVVLFLGVAPDVNLVRGVTISFCLGYLLDLFAGNPMGLETFVLVATFLVTRGAGLRLFLRGPAFQVSLTFVAMLVMGGAATALRAIFETRMLFPERTPLDTATRLFGAAAATALFAPVIFDLARRIESLGASRRDDVGLV